MGFVVRVCGLVLRGIGDCYFVSVLGCLVGFSFWTIAGLGWSGGICFVMCAVVLLFGF